MFHLKQFFHDFAEISHYAMLHNNHSTDHVRVLDNKIHRIFHLVFNICSCLLLKLYITRQKHFNNGSK